MANTENSAVIKTSAGITQQLQYTDVAVAVAVTVIWSKNDVIMTLYSAFLVKGTMGMMPRVFVTQLRRCQPLSAEIRGARPA
jgi:hypothetical protein